MHAAPPDDDDPPPQAPAPPDADACCGSGCERCVFDVFEDARERYLEALRKWQERQAGKTPAERARRRESRRRCRASAPGYMSQSRASILAAE